MGRSSVLSGRIAKKITSKKTKMGSGVHPKSRKANKLGKNLLHQKRVERRSGERQAKGRQLCEKLLWFQSELLSDDNGFDEKRALAHSDVKLLVDRYVECLKNGVEKAVSVKKSVPSKRIQNNSQMKREAKIVHSTEKELAELDAIGIEIPDLVSAENVLRLREWNGEANQLPSIHLVRFKIKPE